MKLINGIYAACLCLLSFSASAIDKAQIDAIAEKVQGHFPNTRFEHMEETHIPGIYAFYIISREDYRIMYWHHATQTILFGEMVTKTGTPITSQAIAKFKAKKMEDLDTSLALKIGNGKHTVIEFVEPECVYCAKYNKYMKEKDDVTRYIFFHNAMGAMHPGADKKSIHVLCSKDPQKALDEVYKPNVNVDALSQCEEGTKMLAEHNKIAKRFKVSGTPTLIVNGTVVSGFGKTQLEKLLKS